MRVASVSPIEASVNALPFGAITSAPALTQRLASGTSAVTTMPPRAGALGDPVVRLVHAGADHDALDHFISGNGDRAVGDDEDFQRDAFKRVPLGDAINLLLHRAGIGVDVDDNGRSEASVMAGLVPAIHVLL